MKIKWVAIAFAVFIAFVILFADLGLLRPIFWLINDIENLDVLLHFILIGTLSFLLVAGVIESFPNRNVNWLALVVMGLLILFFTIEELSQGPIRGRNFSLKDLFANYAGIILFGSLAWVKFRKNAVK